MTKQTKETRSKYWNKLVDILEKEFPKGISKERGHALVLLAYAEMYLKENEPIEQKDKWYNAGFVDGADSTGRVAQEVLAIKIKEIEEMPKYDLSKSGIDGEIYLKRDQVLSILKEKKGRDNN